MKSARKNPHDADYHLGHFASSWHFLSLNAIFFVIRLLSLIIFTIDSLLPSIGPGGEPEGAGEGVASDH